MKGLSCEATTNRVAANPVYTAVQFLKNINIPVSKNKLQTAKTIVSIFDCIMSNTPQLTEEFKYTKVISYSFLDINIPIA